MSHGRHSYVAFYPSDWTAGTARMTRTQRSVYFDVCCEIWDRAEPCPYALLPLLLGDLSDWEQIVEQLVAAGKLTRTPAGLTNARAMDAATKARDLWQKKSAGGKAGAEHTNGSRNVAGNAGGDSPAGSPAATPGRSADAEPEPEPEPEKKGSIGRPQPMESSSSSLSFSHGPMDRVAALTDACLKATGITVSSSKLTAQRDIVAGWLRDGTRPRLIAETLQGAMALLPVGQSVSSLRYFDKRIRQAMKREEARENGHGELSFAELALASARAIREGRRPDDLAGYSWLIDPAEAI